MKNLVKWILFGLIVLMKPSMAQSTWSIQREDVEFPSIGPIYFLNSKVGWRAAGYEPVLYKTLDGGQSWAAVSQKFQVLMGHIQQVWFISPDTGWIVKADGVFKSTDGGRVWRREYITTGGRIYFLNKTTGWLFLPEQILSTQTAGKSWEKVWERNPTNESSPLTANAVGFATESIGWMIKNGSSIFKTVDGGKTWKGQYFFKGTAGGGQSQFFTFDSNRCLVKNGREVLETSNGGIFWEPRTFPGIKLINDLYYLNESYGWVMGDAWSAQDSGIILKTTDGGKNWQRNGSLSQVYRSDGGLYFIDSLHGWCNSGNRTYRTVDGGKAWSLRVKADMLNGVRLFSRTEGVAYGSRHIFKTEDGGISWEPRNVPAPNPLLAGYFLDTATGWVVGEGGGILKTADGGFNWEDQTQPQTTRFTALHAISSVKCWAARNDGAIWATNDGGKKWSPQASALNNYISVIQFLDENIGWAAGAGSSFAQTTDGGKTWKKVSYIGSYFFTAMDFSNRTHGFMVDNVGFGYRTDDGGATWKQQQVALGQYLSSVKFINKDMGWIVGHGESSDPDDSSYVFQTTDGGMTWREVFRTDRYFLWHMSAYDPGNIWAVGENGAVLRYSGSSSQAIFRRKGQHRGAFNRIRLEPCEDGQICHDMLGRLIPQPAILPVQIRVHITN